MITTTRMTQLPVEEDLWALLDDLEKSFEMNISDRGGEAEKLLTTDPQRRFWLKWKGQTWRHICATVGDTTYTLIYARYEPSPKEDGQGRYLVKVRISKKGARTDEKEFPIPTLRDLLGLL